MAENVLVISLGSFIVEFCFGFTFPSGPFFVSVSFHLSVFCAGNRLKISVNSLLYIYISERESRCREETLCIRCMGWDGGSCSLVDFSLSRHALALPLGAVTPISVGLRNCEGYFPKEWSESRAGSGGGRHAACILEPGQAERRIPDYRFGFQMNFLFLEGRTTLVHRIPGDFQRLSRGQPEFLSASGRHLHQAAWRRGSLGYLSDP